MLVLSAYIYFQFKNVINHWQFYGQQSIALLREAEHHLNGVELIEPLDRLYLCSQIPFFRKQFLNGAQWILVYLVFERSLHQIQPLNRDTAHVSVAELPPVPVSYVHLTDSSVVFDPMRIPSNILAISVASRTM